jgi:enhancing lycopene biosynthesis protein 2
MKKFAVILSGCGVFDGSEVHEAVLTLLAVTQHGAGYEIFAPDIEQHHVVNHLTHQAMPEKRNVLVESARIARGRIRPLSEFDPVHFDAMILPGGFGAAKNLSTFAFDGPQARVNQDLEKAVRGIHSLHKPIGALCIAPAVITRILGNIEVTIGDDPGTAQAIARMGGKHIVTGHGEVVIDHQHKVFTTPCYMLEASIKDIYDGAMNIVGEMMRVM